MRGSLRPGKQGARNPCWALTEALSSRGSKCTRKADAAGSTDGWLCSQTGCSPATDQLSDISGKRLQCSKPQF